jgi:UMF1 family MFS transporter
MHRKHVSVWALYDFANSIYPAVITVTVFGVYFSNRIVGNETGRGDLLWGLVVSCSMMIVALSSPLLGSIADRAGVRKKMLALYTGLCIICVALFTTIEPGMIAWAFLLAVTANIGFEGALVYYNAYLPDIVPPEKQGRVSGLGFGVGYAGSAVGIMVALPLVARDRFDLTWLAVAGFFAVFSLPTFLWLPADTRGSRTVRQAAIDGVTGFKRLLADVWNVPDLRRFLIAFFVYIDGVNTTVVFAANFAKKTLGFTQPELIYMFLVVQMSALLGAFALAKPTDTWGAKRVITATLILWTTVAVAAFFVHSKPVFFAIAVLAGTGLGAVQAASRALMAGLTPKGKEAEMFGFYAFCGKSSAVVGPLLFGLISFSLGGNQRIAILSVAAFFLAGLILLQRVRDPRRGVGDAA